MHVSTMTIHNNIVIQCTTLYELQVMQYIYILIYIYIINCLQSPNTLKQQGSRVLKRKHNAYQAWRNKSEYDNMYLLGHCNNVKHQKCALLKFTLLQNVTKRYYLGHMVYDPMIREIHHSLHTLETKVDFTFLHVHPLF